MRGLLGGTAISEHKLMHGNPLEILGVEATIQPSGIKFKPAKAKLQKWAAKIKQALRDRTLLGGEASKLAGKSYYGVNVWVVSVIAHGPQVVCNGRRRTRLGA